MLLMSTGHFACYHLKSVLCEKDEIGVQVLKSPKTIEGD